MAQEVERCPMSTEEVLKELKDAKEAGALEEKLVDLFMGYAMDMRTTWECRQYFGDLTDDVYMRNPGLLTVSILIEAMAGRLEDIDKLMEPLGKTPEDLTGYVCTPIDIARIMLEIVLPQTDDRQFIQKVTYLAKALESPSNRLALTACRPSVINGFRDMTMHCPGMEEKEKEICQAIDVFYGNSGKGVYEVALAEWKYETGEMFNSLLKLASIIPILEDEKDVRCLFAAYVLQMRILVIKGQTRNDSEIFEKIRDKVTKHHYDELKQSLDAVICLYHCYEADYDYVENWLENTAPNENGEVFLMDMYCYLVKMRCYLLTGKYMLTTLLAKKMINYLRQSYRPHDMCECLLLSAIACLKAGDEDNAVSEFEQALSIGEQYGYVRLFADEGQVVIELIKLYKEKRKATNQEGHKIFNEDWLKKIRGHAIEVANRYPNYLKTRQEEYAHLTKTERQIVLLMAAGLPNEDIASQMDKKEKTIKFHITNIFSKLHVKNRQQAINRAREIGYL